MRGVVPWTHLAMGLLLLVPGFGVAQPAKEIDSAAVDNLVRKTLETWKVPGAALVIVRDDKVVHLKGYGVKEVGKDQAVTPDTVFPLASCTKGFTTAAMAVLVSEGKMHWDDPVSPPPGLLPPERSPGRCQRHPARPGDASDRAARP